MRTNCLATFFTPAVFVAIVGLANAQNLPIVRGVELQPLAAQVERVAQALELAGSPLTKEQQAALDAALVECRRRGRRRANPENARSAVPGGRRHQSREPRESAARPAPKKLVQQGWRVFLVKVHNEAGVTAPLRVQQPQRRAAARYGQRRPSRRRRSSRPTWCSAGWM